MTRRLAGALTMLILLAGLLALAANAAEPEGATTELPTIGKWLEDHGLGPRAVVLVIAMLPIIELRGALPVAILYRGAGLSLVWPQFVSLALIGATLFGLSLARFRKTLATMA